MIILLIVLFISSSIFLINCLAYNFNIKAFHYNRYLRFIKNQRKFQKPTLLNNKLKIFCINLIKLNTHKREKLEIALNRCNFNVTPEEYYFNAFRKSFLVSLISVLLYLCGIKLAAICCVILSVMVFARNVQSVYMRLEEINSEILDEIPAFIRSFSYGLESSRDMVAIIEKYRLVSKPALARELDILLTNMKTMNYEEALRKFEQRVNLPAVSTFVSGLIGVDRGIDYKTFFYILEENIKILARENLKREISKRPRKLKKCIVSMILALFILYLIPIFIQIQSGFDIFK